MPKRKSDESQKRAIKKLRRLEKKLRKYKDKLQQSEDSQDSLEVVENVENIDPIQVNNESIVIENIHEEEIIEDAEELSKEFLEALGDPADTEKRVGDAINKNIIQRFEKILIEGMKLEDKERVLKDLCFPENGALMKAPKLNVELLSVLTSSMKARDKMLEERQEDTGYVIATICQSIDMLTKPNLEENLVTIVKHLGDATRILCNLHFKYTDIRRKMISPLLDKNIDLNLKDNKRSEWLYSKLDDAVKSASAIKKASAVLMPKKAKNWQPPPRQPSHFHRGRGSARGGYQHLPQSQPRYQTRLPPRQNQYQARRLAPTTSNTRGVTRGRSRYP